MVRGGCEADERYESVDQKLVRQACYCKTMSSLLSNQGRNMDQRNEWLRYSDEPRGKFISLENWSTHLGMSETRRSRRTSAVGLRG
jgi:hypothetical protein